MIFFFPPHFAEISVKIDRVIGFLIGIMPNVRGPNEGRRKLYVNIVYSIILYGAPIWSDIVLSNDRIKALLDRIVRRIAQRTCRAYKTVSKTAAVLIAGIIPPEYMAKCQTRVYNRIREAARREIVIEDRTLESLYKHAKKIVFEDWKREVVNMRDWEPSLRVREAIIPIMKKWYDRSHGSMTFHMTQAITGHGCFSSFLYKIKKIGSMKCAHCDAALDDAVHTVEVCPAWSEEREDLRNQIGQDLSLRNILSGIVLNKDKWKSFSKFCSLVMGKKEETERIRKVALGDSTSVGPPCDVDSFSN
jgi:hypothetical protein